jgi:hypothetical protein
MGFRNFKEKKQPSRSQILPVDMNSYFNRTRKQQSIRRITGGEEAGESQDENHFGRISSRVNSLQVKWLQHECQ